ncbi:hypothetical protein T01_7742 [Trichinella spiralis]|uniref:Uncharacterized protein n=1 Tax=Trichinella spiralis TaxID=6334 RepID=A0A0V0YWR0_TRISP|nr:hypothetical protein T01_7742 [Trichinella spiralis]
MDQGSEFRSSASGCQQPSHHNWCTNPQSSLFDLAI